MTTLRFCLITTFYPPYHFGGDGIFVYRLAEALAALGHDVHVLHSIDAYRLQSRAEPTDAFSQHSNVRTFPLETGSPFWSALSVHQTGTPGAYDALLEKHFDEHSYDVIHYHNVSLMGAPGLLKMGRGVKLYTTHEYWLICPTHILFKFNDHACESRSCVACTLQHKRPPQLWRYTNALGENLEYLNALIMPSDFARTRHARDGVQKNAVVIPHFVPIPDDEQLKASFQNEGRPYFLVAGRLEKLKGVQDLIEIFKRYDAADLVVVGDGSYATELRAQAAGLAHVKFTGAVHPSNMTSYFRGAIGVMVPSLCYEVFPLSAAEALAAGAPLIGRRIGAVQELIEKSGGGMTFDTLAECEAAMEVLRTNNVLRHTLSGKGREYAQNDWSVQTHLNRYLSLVNEHRQTQSLEQPERTV